MALFGAPLFVTGPFTPQRVFLPDREYGLALDALVKACSDVLVVSSDGTKVLLGRRKVEPQPDFWFIGGRSRCLWPALCQHAAHAHLTRERTSTPDRATRRPWRPRGT